MTHHRRRHRAVGAFWVVPIATASGIGLAVEAPGAPSPDSVDTIVVQGQKLNVESKIDRKVYTVPGRGARISREP